MQELLFMHRQMCDSHLAEASKFGAISDQRSVSYSAHHIKIFDHL